jgi:hypothetical protein
MRGTSCPAHDDFQIMFGEICATTVRAGGDNVHRGYSCTPRMEDAPNAGAASHSSFLLRSSLIFADFDSAGSRIVESQPCASVERAFGSNGIHLLKSMTARVGSPSAASSAISPMAVPRSPASNRPPFRMSSSCGFRPIAPAADAASPGARKTAWGSGLSKACRRAGSKREPAAQTGRLARDAAHPARGINHSLTITGPCCRIPKRAGGRGA